MDPDEWLERYAHGYRQLSQDERAAMKNFAFLWSYFEATCLNKNASAPAIAAFCTDMKARKRLRIADYQAAIEYFSKRYFDGANTTPQFDGLNLPNTRQRAMVLKAISGQKVSDDDLLASLLVIIYRLRNNLMHGEKWAYGIKGQLSNFDHANNVLMVVKLANP
jgi:hypothetical protein